MTTTNVWYNGPAHMAEQEGIKEARERGFRDPIVVRVVPVSGILGVVISDGPEAAEAERKRVPRRAAK